MAARKKAKRDNPRVVVISLPGESGKKMKEALTHYADSNDRTISSQARVIFRGFLKRRGYELDGGTDECLPPCLISTQSY